eukprot:1941498-Rhodomonas_salina.1
MLIIVICMLIIVSISISIIFISSSSSGNGAEEGDSEAGLVRRLQAGTLLRCHRHHLLHRTLRSSCTLISSHQRQQSH